MLAKTIGGILLSSIFSWLFPASSSLYGAASALNLENNDILRLSRALGFSNSLRALQSGEGTGENFDCGEILVEWNSTEIANGVDEILLDAFDATSFEYLGLTAALTPLLKHGVQIRKACASCIDFEDASDAYTYFCGPDAHGFNATVSGLVAFPLDLNGGPDIHAGTLPGHVYAHPTTITDYPSNNWSSFLTALFTIVPASSGYVTIAPDYMGYGESRQTACKSYIVNRAYKTATVPLWYEAHKIMEEETNCRSALADATTVLGYSEGGYAAVSIAQALDSLGVEVILVEAGGAPFRVGTIAIPKLVESVDLGNYPRDQHKSLALVGSAYSSTNPNLANFGRSQDLLKSSTRDEIVNLVKLGQSDDGILALIPEGAPLTIFDDSYVEWARLIIQEGDLDACGNNSMVAFNNTEFVCQALKENDLTQVLESVSYPVKLCHSPDDEVVSFQNLPNLTKNPILSLVPVTGDHDDAGGSCLFQSIQSLADINLDDFDIQDQHQPLGCSTLPPTPEPTVSPTTSSPATRISCGFFLAFTLLPLFLTG